jgi:NtrC-family two-component system sensor histidine kinase KinB
MRFRRLQMRFLLAGCLLVTTTVACGLWSALTFARLSAVVDRTLQESQETIDLAAVLAGTLERDDDALLLSLAGEEARAGRERAAQRQRFDEAYRRLLPLMFDPEEKAAASALGRHVDEYRAAGDALRAAAGQADAHRRYHERVNPVLRQAVGDCERIRELNFRSMQAAGIKARDEANRATAIVAGLSLAALVVSTLVSIRLARSVLGPVHELTASVDAVRLGNFDRRVRLDSADELGQLADGFNRMTETLAEYRSSSLGELLEAKWTLEAALDALPDAVIVVEPDGRVVGMNPPARAVLQSAQAGEVSRVEQLPLSPDHLAAVREALRGRSSVKSHTEFSRTLAFTLDGSKRQFLLTAVPVPQFAPKDSFGAVVVLDDVTDIARLDELRTELVGVASHELKTPLTTLRMNLLLLGEGAENLTPRQREVLKTAVGGCEELGATIDELLDLTRIEAGQLRLAHDRVDVDAVIEHAVRTLRARFEDAAITLDVCRDARSTTVRGDAARLGIVFANVLTNALKYTPSGGRVTIRVSSQQNAGAGGKDLLHIAVTDTGPGIPEEFRERVFEKFFRVEHHRPGNGHDVRGTGIGLYLCREIVEAHGGSIRCEPGDDGRGTRIAILLQAVV